MRRLGFIAVVILVAVWGAWWSGARLPIVGGSPAIGVSSSALAVSFEDLQEGDFVWDRSPPLIPGRRLGELVDKRVCIEGEYSFTGDGSILLTRRRER